MSLDVNQIKDIIKLVSQHKLSEFIYKTSDFKLVVRQGSGDGAPVPVVVQTAPVPTMAPVQQVIAAQPVAAPATDAPAKTADATPTASDESKYLVIKAPMIGVFYRRPAKDKDPFVEVGDMVDTKTKVCIIEAMKLFNEIEADVKGRIVKILIEDGASVDFGKPMFLVDPS
ncbi:MAG: acetyl-CoA carboxylase biotin carboxyl carrier protein [Saprospiraceae bacterium]|nr:acetyl-CoA carboxylase biotin carboxyl carrier protein [Saprospiraceae bacterium]